MAVYLFSPEPLWWSERLVLEFCCWEHLQSRALSRIACRFCTLVVQWHSRLGRFFPCCPSSDWRLPWAVLPGRCGTSVREIFVQKLCHWSFKFSQACLILWVPGLCLCVFSPLPSQVQIPCSCFLPNGCLQIVLINFLQSTFTSAKFAS